MDWQLAITLFLIGLAGALVLRQAWRVWLGSKTGCGGGCDCAKTTPERPGQAKPTIIPPEQLVLRNKREAPG